MAVEEAPESAVAAALTLRVLVGRLRRQLHEASAVGELTASQASALARIAMNEPASTSVLAGAERVRPQSMAAIVVALEQQGLVRREDDPDDGRRQLIFLTAAGQEQARGARASREEWLTQALAQRLSEAERAVVNEALALLERILES